MKKGKFFLALLISSMSIVSCSGVGGEGGLFPMGGNSSHYSQNWSQADNTFYSNPSIAINPTSRPIGQNPSVSINVSGNGYVYSNVESAPV